MSRYAVFIRAINVGGRSVRMDDIASGLAKAGFENVSIFRQSGNLVLSSSIQDEGEIDRIIAEEMERLTGLNVEIFLVPMERLARLVDAAPFDGLLSDGDRGFATFLSARPTTVPEMPFIIYKGIIMIGLKDAVVLSIVRKDEGSGPANDLIERTYGVRATTRNWSTVKGLVEKERNRDRS